MIFDGKEKKIAKGVGFIHQEDAARQIQAFKSSTEATNPVREQCDPMP